MNNIELSEQELVRRQSLEKMRALGIDPYPAPKYEVNIHTDEIKEKYSYLKEEEHAEDFTACVAGRLMSRRIMGSASFAELQDSKGRIQLYFNRDVLCPTEDKTMYNDVFKKLLDIGDIIGVKGKVFRTKMGELSVRAEELTVLCKSLKPLPIVKEKDGKVYDAFTNPELRYRKRYVDLIVNPQVKEVFVKRTKLMNTMRQYLDALGCLEVETPILQPIYGGASARPFKTHHNALDQTLYLRIANELYLKRLIVGGFDGVYEFSKDFRNEGMDRFHNPEFTQIELYVAYKDYFWMMDTVEEMVEKVAIALNGDTKVKVGENVIDFKRPWKRFTMFEAIQHFTGVDISQMDEKELAETAKKFGVEVDSTMGKGKLIDEIFGETCEAKIIQPTFITDYPVEMSPLTKKHRSKEGLVERFEAICNGKELCNAYSELNDPIDQRQRFEDQLLLAKRGDEEAMVLDEDFLTAIDHGMPPTAGIGIGIDRLTMIMTNSESIQDVLFFPQMKPEKKFEYDPVEAYTALGIPEEWVSLIQKLGFLKVENLKDAKPGKLFNDLCSLNKKGKLNLTNPSADDVKAWVEKAGE